MGRFATGMTGSTLRIVVTLALLVGGMARPGSAGELEAILEGLFVTRKFAEKTFGPARCFMGLPKDNPDGYRAGSPINFAEGLRGRLLIVHGSGDDNVHFQGTELLVNRLVQLGKPFDLMVYPNRTHSISEGDGTSLHVHKLLARYLIEHVQAGPLPR